MIVNIGRTLPTILAFLGLVSISSTASAQGNTFNPYGNSGYADYREFGNPMVSNNPALPGQALLNSSATVSRPRANSFQQYASELDGADSDTSAYRRGSSNVPYFQAYQRLNAQNNRVYRPNNTDDDRKFYERQRQRDQDYAKALEERDPAKRAKLLRQVELNSLNRPAASPRSNTTKGSTTTKAATVPKPGVGTTSPSARSSAPTERRLPAPSPFATSPTARRPTTPRSRLENITDATKPASGATTRVAPDPSTIPVPAPR